MSHTCTPILVSVTSSVLEILLLSNLANFPLLEKFYSTCIHRIWQHLLELVERTRTTIIITTHYIEEARQAQVVSNAAQHLLPSIP